MLVENNKNDKDQRKYKWLNWNGAQTYCRGLKTKGFKYDLISFDSEEEYNAVLDYDWSDIYTKNKETFGIWVGLNKGKKDGWEWSDRSSLEYANPKCPRWEGKEGSTPWRKGEPDGTGGCVRTYGDEGLIDDPCNWEFPFMCKGRRQPGKPLKGEKGFEPDCSKWPKEDKQDCIDKDDAAETRGKI